MRFRGGGFLTNCHPERSEGSAFGGELQIPRVARDDKSDWIVTNLSGLRIDGRTLAFRTLLAGPEPVV
jgi:hypothetical protein